jgi:hypothetical protein
MLALRQWSFARVALACVAWIVVTPILIVLWIVRQALWVVDTGTGGGVGAVSFGVNTFMLVIPVAPPLVLLAAWILARRRKE